MTWARTTLAVTVAVGAAALAMSGGSRADPQTPPGLPGLPPPFLGVAVVGDGGLTAAVDAYGDVVDLRVPGPAGQALIENSAKRQAAGTVPANTGIVPRVSVGSSPPLPLWRADWVRQAYLPGTNVLRTVARIGPARLEITDAARGETLARTIEVSPSAGVHTALTDAVNIDAGHGVRCREARGQRRALMVCSASAAEPASAPRIVRAATRSDRRWISRARSLGSAAPGWARTMYERSLLVLRALTDRRTGAVAAGARDSWAYVWPRDAAAAAIAFASAGYRHEARRVTRFLLGVDLNAAARFRGTGEPVGGRAAEGDATGWTAAAVQAAGLQADMAGNGKGRAVLPSQPAWRDRADYQEGSPGDYLANAIASATPTAADGPISHDMRGFPAHRRAGEEMRAMFETSRGLVRRAGDPSSGLDSAAAWAVRPFPHPDLFPLARRTLLRLAARGGRFGITPGEDWPGKDPWTAPTAWTVWSLATLARRAEAHERGGPGSKRIAQADRRAALRLLGDLRRAATPAGLLPERVDAHTGVPSSTTPLAWSHAFTILALHQLWPGRGGS